MTSSTPSAIAATTAASVAAAASTAQTRRDVATMQAVVQHRYGSADTLTVEEVERPEIGPGEVLIRVRAAGVDRGVWHLMTGLPFVVRLAGYGLRRPKQQIPGLDVAGTVVEVGADVTGFAVGDEVYGVATGSYAEYARADAGGLTHRPEQLSPEAAATIAVSGATATQALLDVAQATAGQRVLVLGASGGVGSYVTQLAHALGLHVTGVASAAKASHVRDLGADVVLDYATEDFTDQPAFDVIIDTGGRNGVAKLRRALTRRGTLVIVGGEGGGRITGGVGRQLRAMLWSPFISQRLTTFISTTRATDWAALRELIDQGRVVAPVDHAYPLSEAADALRDLEAGRVSGKAVITVS
jgi:NADPH:quinone reductase-like Zn-dependent oxidoreductase